MPHVKQFGGLLRVVRHMLVEFLEKFIHFFLLLFDHFLFEALGLCFVLVHTLIPDLVKLVKFRQLMLFHLQFLRIRLAKS